MNIKSRAAAFLLALCLLPANYSLAQSRFSVPGHDDEIAVVNDIHRSFADVFTNCTLWDAWLPHGTLWANDLAAVRYRDVFLQRPIDRDGYVAMQQHRGMAHSAGWPFPAWQQSTGRGWHFSIQDEGWAVQNFGTQALTNTEGWDIKGAEVLPVDPASGLKLRAKDKTIVVTTPQFQCGTVVAPFVRLEWANSSPEAVSRITWRLAGEAAWNEKRFVEVPVDVANRGLQYSNAPMYRHPQFNGMLTQLRWTIDCKPGDEITLKSLITAIDTRHPITNSLFVTGSSEYFLWTGDIEFLKQNIARMRSSLEFAIREFSVEQGHFVNVPWVGHEGRSGLIGREQGPGEMRPGLGVGNNYWDLLPFGGQDAIATMYLYKAINDLSEIETAIAAHREWKIAAPQRSAAQLTSLANSIRDDFQKRFWDTEKGRFIGWIDRFGDRHDFGFTFVNLEAIHYGLASNEQAKSILEWLDGKRAIEGDTSTGADIYHWRFAPRATTKRNIGTYCWVWNNPGSIPWGGQIQDGGAVLGFSYFDLTSRLRTISADDAWARLRQIVQWQKEVDAEGGYRSYYSKPGRGSLQGCGTPGGLGVDCEFMETVLLPQIMVSGFLGLKPTAEGFQLHPKLPSDWPSLAIRDIHVHGYVLNITAKADSSAQIEVMKSGDADIVIKSGNQSYQLKRSDKQSQIPTNSK